MGGQRSHRKGFRTGAKVSHLVQQAGMECPRAPISGSNTKRAGVVIMAGRPLEVKAGTNGFRQLSYWLQERFGLILSADPGEPLIVLRLGDFLKQLQFRDTSQIAMQKHPAGILAQGLAMGRKKSRHD